MVIDRQHLQRAGATLVALLAWSAAAAAAGVPGLGIVDARHAAAQVVVAPPPTPALLPFVRLSDPNARRVECCVRVQPGQIPATITRAGAGGDADALPPLQAQPARVLPASEAGPFVGLVLPPSSGARVLARTAHALTLQWFVAGGEHAQRARVRHCLSSEGLHVWWRPLSSARAKPASWEHVYLPLGMDVEADCPRAWLQP